MEICLNVCVPITKKAYEMKILKKPIILLTSILTCYSAISAETNKTVIGDVEMPEVQNSKAFNEVKKKLGKWEGKMTQYTGKVFDVSYEWKLTSGGNTITETIVEDGVEMLTTYSDKDGELVIKHYCALGTEPIFKVSQTSENVLAIVFDKSRSDLHAEHHSFVDSMKWTMDAEDSNSMKFENTVNLDGEQTKNKAELRRIY